MIIYVDLEHDRLQNRPDLWEKSLAARLKHKYRLEALTGEPCLIVRYFDFTPALLRQFVPPVRAVIISGCHTDYEHYPAESLAGLLALYQEAAWPMLGLCAGQQLMAYAYGAAIGPIGPLAPGEPDPYGGLFIPGMKQERGFMPVTVCTPHPLFAGLPQHPVFFQSHYWEVKTVPPSFNVLAKSDLCGVQAIAHTNLRLFGVQFHPEEYDNAHLDGCKLLENFFQMVNSP